MVIWVRNINDLKGTIEGTFIITSYNEDYGNVGEFEFSINVD